MPLDLARKATVIAEHRQSEQDTGSPEVQVSIMSTRISDLTEHLKIHTGDHASRRGLLRLVGRRKRLLEYLKRENIDRYRALIETLGLRR